MRRCAKTEAGADFENHVVRLEFEQIRHHRNHQALRDRLIETDGNSHGRSRFQLLQNALNKKAKLLYVVFDALFVGTKDIREKLLLERKKILKALMPRDPLLRYSEHVAEFGTREFAKAQRAHEEGVIAKRAAGLYYSGKRTREWLKFKAVHEQEVVIIGYTEPRRSRKYFGSLVLAVPRQCHEALSHSRVRLPE